MSKHVDSLLDKFESEINNSSYDMSKLCSQLNEGKMNDDDILRIIKLLFKYKKWSWLIMALLLIISFYIFISLTLSILFTGLYFLMTLVLPPSIAIGITLLLMMFTLSKLQCE